MLQRMNDQAGLLLAAKAPKDVQETIDWLLTNGYKLAAYDGGDTFGAQLVYDGPSQVRVTVDRSQWMLEIAAKSGSELIQYDLAIVADSGVTYGERFPDTGQRPQTAQLPDQLPVGASWYTTLPQLLDWVRQPGAFEAAEVARRQRDALMWGQKPSRE